MSNPYPTTQALSLKKSTKRTLPKPVRAADVFPIVARKGERDLEKENGLVLSVALPMATEMSMRPGTFLRSG
jgi:hypothetical protein